MTIVRGVAVDPESGEPIAGRMVTATLWPPGSTTAPIVGGVDLARTDEAGAWELILPPTAGLGVVAKIRIWRSASLFADIPVTDPPTLPVDVTDYLVDPDTLEPISQTPELYITRAERGAPNGVASLDATGKVPANQLPPAGGGGGFIALGFLYEIGDPTTVAIITHELGFDPAGVEALHTDGSNIHPLLSYTTPGQEVRLDFRDDFTGIVRLS
jgi:hypothetical protein